MALTLMAKDRSSSLEDAEDRLLAMFERFGVRAVEFRKIHDALYGDPTLGPEQVKQLRSEFAELRGLYSGARMAELKRERNVFARDRALERKILEGLLAGDALLGKIDEVLGVCDAAVRAGEGIVCASD